MTLRAAACFALACLFVGGCSSNAGKDGGKAPPPPAPPAATTNTHANQSAGDLGFALDNFTGATLQAVYVSPGDSGGWEENVLGGRELSDGETVEIRFSPEERADVWDIRVEGVDGHFAEWKGLRLGGVSRLTMHLDVIGERVVVIEIE